MALIDPITDYARAAETLADEFESAPPVGAVRPTNILDPGYDLTLRPMRYPQFYEMTVTPSRTRGPSRRSTSPTTSSTWTAS